MTNRAVVVNCFDTYERRARLVYNFFRAKGYDTIMLTSSFSHVYKREIGMAERCEGYIYLHTHPYYKNLSLRRMYSHFKLSKVILAYLENIKPDVLYVLCPPNTFAKVGGQYKMRHKHSILIIDIIDLWPETLPIKCPKDIFPLNVWRNVRNKWLPLADCVILECDLYARYIQHNNVNTLYFAKSDTGIVISPYIDERVINLCYLGSINNLIDIDIIARLITAIKQYKAVCLHIIGDGHKREKLLKIASSAGADIVYYGKVFDEIRKHKIFSKCNFGLNIMKETVCVGLTIKSIDYFEAGLPIINSIQGDTWSLVEQYHVGVNIQNNDIDDIALKICATTSEDNRYMRKQCRKLFLEEFLSDAFRKKLSYFAKKDFFL